MPLFNCQTYGLFVNIFVIVRFGGGSNNLMPISPNAGYDAR